MPFTDTPEEGCCADSMLTHTVAAHLDLQDEIHILLQAIHRAEHEPYTYLVAHLKERLRLIQDDAHCSMVYF